MTSMNGYPDPREVHKKAMGWVDEHKPHQRLSTLAAVVAWGIAAFGSYPTIASLLYHLLVMPPVLIFLVWAAHREGHQDATRELE